MKTTDEMILDLHEKAGFVLPEGLEHQIKDMGMTGYWTLENDTPEHRAPVPGQLAHDLCAMGYARQVDSSHFRREGTEAAWIDAMHDGDSAAAIKALWEGVCA